jgi:urease accessory protein
MPAAVLVSRIVQRFTTIGVSTMKSRFAALIFGLSVLSVWAPATQAHTFGLHGAGFVEGLTHPLLGLDHLLAMIAVGIWAAQLGGRLTWLMPATFLVTMASAAGLASTGLRLPLLEPAIAGTVLALGLLIAFAVRVGATQSFALIGVFALLHGYSHGLELPKTATPLLYGLGFVLTTAGLHGAGVLLGMWARRVDLLTRTCGSAIALTGLYLLAAA